MWVHKSGFSICCFCCTVLILNLLYMPQNFWLQEHILNKFFLRNSLTLMGIFIHKRLLPKIYSCLEAFSNVTNNGYWSGKHTCLRIYKGAIFLQPPNLLQLWHQFSLYHFQEPCSFILSLRVWQLEFQYYLGGLTVRMSIRKKKKKLWIVPSGKLFWMITGKIPFH